jgi:stringent starvation protein B
MANLKDLKNRREEAAKNQSQKGSSSTPQTNTYSVNEKEYVGLELNKDNIFRIVGEPAEERKAPTDAKHVFVSQILRDKKDGYTKIYFPYTKIDDFNYVPDKDFLLLRLHKKVNQYNWIKYTKDDIGKYKGLVEKPDGEIINADGRNGFKEFKYENTEIYQLVNGNTREGDKVPKSFYPEHRVLLNVIDRMDSWCKDNKKTKILCKSVTSSVSKRNNQTYWYIEAGIPFTLYNSIIDRHARFAGDWEAIDTLVLKTKDANAKRYSYGIYDGSDVKELLDNANARFIVSGNLSDEEKKYQRIDFDDRYSTRYNTILLNHSGLISIFDKEFPEEHMMEELEVLSMKEKNEKGTKQVHKEIDAAEEAADKEISEERNAPAEESAPAKRESVTAKPVSSSTSEEDVLKFFPKLNEVSADNKSKIVNGIASIQGEKIFWKKEAGSITQCFIEDKCKFPNGTLSGFPTDVTQCPVCGTKGE